MSIGIKDRNKSSKLAMRFADEAGKLKDGSGFAQLRISHQGDAIFYSETSTRI